VRERTLNPCSAYIAAESPPKRPSSTMWVTPAKRAAVTTARILIGRMSEKRHGVPLRQLHICWSSAALWPSKRLPHEPIVSFLAQRRQPSRLRRRLMSPSTW